jgi:protein O-GlcNAc transferase
VTLQVVQARMEKFTIREQLEMTRNTNILLGVHGAGMTHIFTLPPQSVVIEMQPFDGADTTTGQLCYANFARMMGLT